MRLASGRLVLFQQNAAAGRQGDDRAAGGEGAAVKGGQIAVDCQREGDRLLIIAVDDIITAILKATDHGVAAGYGLQFAEAGKGGGAFFRCTDVEYPRRLGVEQNLADRADLAVDVLHVVPVLTLGSVAVAHRVGPTPKRILTGVPIGKIGEPMETVRQTHIDLPQDLGIGEIAVGTVFDEQHDEHLLEIVIQTDATDVFHIFKEDIAVFQRQDRFADHPLTLVDCVVNGGNLLVAAEEMVVVVTDEMRFDHLGKPAQVGDVVHVAQLFGRGVVGVQIDDRFFVGGVFLKRRDDGGQRFKAFGMRLVADIEALDIIESGVVGNHFLDGGIGRRRVVFPIDLADTRIAYVGADAVFGHNGQGGFVDGGVVVELCQRDAGGGHLGDDLVLNDVLRSGAEEKGDIKPFHCTFLP